MPRKRNPYTRRPGCSPGHLLLLTRGREYFAAIGKLGGRISGENRRIGAHQETRVLLPITDKEQIRTIARSTGVSLGCVIREAVSFYLTALAEDEAKAPGRAKAETRAKDQAAKK